MRWKTGNIHRLLWPSQFISLEDDDDKLFYRRDYGPNYPLVYIWEDWFLIEEIPYFKIHFIWNHDVIVAIEGEQ